MSDVLKVYDLIQVGEWNSYVADGPVDIDGVRAFNDGDPVPRSHVERGIVPLAKVRKPGDLRTPEEVVSTVPKGAYDLPSEQDIVAALNANRESGIEVD
jgi:hypothetical protein